MWRASVLTIFPEMFPGPLAQSLAGKALTSGIWSLDTIDIRAHAHVFRNPGSIPEPSDRHSKNDHDDADDQHDFQKGEGILIASHKGKVSCSRFHVKS
jgi:hypothetical protein